MAQPRTMAERHWGLHIASWLRLDNRDELAAAFGWQAPERHRATDEDYVLEAYRRWDTACAARLEGDFAFVICDDRDLSVFAARDAVGIRPLYYALTPTLFAASPTAANFTGIAEVDTSVRSEWLADYIHGLSGDWETTPFPGVRRLPPGHWLRVTPHDSEMHRYHQFDIDSPWENTRDPRWLAAYRDELHRAVARRTDPANAIGVENSGGIDSATILAVMAHDNPELRHAIHTFGFAGSEQEPELIAATPRKFSLTHNHNFPPLSRTTATDADARGWQAVGYPVEHGNATAHLLFYELASQLGIASLHSGHGGDEIVTNTGSLAIAEMVARRNWFQPMRDLPGPLWLRPARLAKRSRRRTSDISHLTVPMMNRLAATPLRADVFAERRIAGRTFASAMFDAPHHTINGFITQTRMGPMMSIRTADCSLVAATYGIDYRWALLDRGLIQQYLHTPTVWKYGEGYGRYLHRRAVTGIVPDEVAWKRSKDMGPRLPSTDADAGRPSIPIASARAHVRTATTADALLHVLPAQLRDLLDAQRLTTLATLPAKEPEGLAARRYLKQVATLADWLNARQAHAEKG